MSLHIFTRDLRIQDNTTIRELLKKSDDEDIYFIFVFTPLQVKDNSYKSNNAIQFMVESLKDLNKTIKGKLGLFYGDYDSIIRKIIKNKKIKRISITKDYTPFSKKREDSLEKICGKNIEFILIEDYCINSPKTIKLYQKYTPYKNTSLYKIKFTKSNVIPKKTNFRNNRIKKIKGNFSFKKTEKLYKNNNFINLHGGRKNGLKQLNKIKLQKEYNNTRNSLNPNNKTTELSAYIKFGCISIREVYRKIIKTLGSDNQLINQIIWRDFYFQLGAGFPRVLNGKSLKEKYDKIKWDNNTKFFKAWMDGKTGFPIVDAGMRQLNKTGFMHNRTRLITASFLVKTLLIDWRYGEKYFATQLYDYDPLVNNGNWQWVSSSGADSQPYFRIFNPWTQGKTHDPDCLYIKKWIPELTSLEPKIIHNWYKHHKSFKTEVNYTSPIVNLSKQKKIVMNEYKKVFE